MEPLCAAIRSYLSTVHGLASLRLQNHIYGCYLLLEDIVQKTVIFNGTRITNQNRTFDLRDQFSEIGLRYGFAMDTQLLLHPCPTDYIDSWIYVFINTKTLEEVDAIEEAVNGIIEKFVPSEEAFFIGAKDGFLPPEWVDRALTLLMGGTVSETPATESDNKPVTELKVPAVEPKVSEPKVSEPKVSESKPSSAILEKHKDNPKRLFASTRRRKGIVHAPKRILATTRRALKSPSVPRSV